MAQNTSPQPAGAQGCLPQFHVVGFTGHRQLADPGAASACVEAELARLQSMAPGEWLGLSSAAAGSDLLFARALLDRGIAWQVLLPLPAEEFRRDFTAEEWREAEQLLASAESVRVIGEQSVREDAYLDCGIETVEACDILVALWDGEPARGRGGTAEIVAYARELGRPVILIDPDSGDVRRERLETWQVADPEVAFLNSLPDVGTSCSGTASARECVERLYRRADAAADRSAPRFRLLTTAVVVLHVTATLVATAGLAFDWHTLFLPWAKLLLVLAALATAVAIRHYRAQHRWIRCRLAAEICRAALATWGMPRRAVLFADLELPRIQQFVRSLHLLHRRSAPAKPPSLDAFRQHYLGARIEHQLHYYRYRLGRASRQLFVLRFGFVASTVLAILCMGAYALQTTLDLQMVARPLEAVAFHFLPIALPAVAAAFISLIAINDLHRRVARYREMCALLDLTGRQLSVTHTWHSLERLVQRTERSLLQEVLEWHALMSHLESH